MPGALRAAGGQSRKGDCAAKLLGVNFISCIAYDGKSCYHKHEVRTNVLSQREEDVGMREQKNRSTDWSTGLPQVLVVDTITRKIKGVSKV